MFVIVRHGNTFAVDEAARRIGARTDLPLTKEGEDQARALGIHFAALGWHFSRVLVSPLVRTRATARAILERQAVPLVAKPCDWLREIDYGPDEDRPEVAVRSRVGTEALEAWDARGEVPPGWIVEPEARLAAWRALFAHQPAFGPTLLVTSNGVARFALLSGPNVAPANLSLPTGGYGVIRRGSDGTLEVPVWGRRP